MNGLLRLLFGSYRLTFTSENPERIVNFALRQNLPFWSLCRMENGLSFSVRPWHRRYLAPFRESLREGETLAAQPEGMLRLLLKQRCRIGFFLGFFLLVLTLFLSTRVLWGVTITGMQTVEKKELRAELEAMGLVPGTLLSRIDAKDLAMRYQIQRGDLVYVNINLVGTRAYVEVRERLFSDPISPEEGFSNQVASIHGRVVRYEVLSGQIEVKKGDYVTSGALLISGVRENKNGTFSTVRAKGRVFAETQREFETTVPLQQEGSFPSGREKEMTTFSVLGLSFPFSTRGEIRGEGICILDRREPLTLFGYQLPILVRERVFLETEEKKETITVDRAEAFAYDKYDQFIRDTFADGDEVLAQEVEITRGQDAVTLTAKLSAIENICKEQPFGVTSP